MLNAVNEFVRLNSQPTISTIVRHLRGKPPHLARSLQERLKRLSLQDNQFNIKVDIGLPPPPSLSKKTLQKRINFLKKIKNDLELQRKAENLTIEVDTDIIREDWKTESAAKHIQAVADHYGVFEHLFGQGYFTPYVIMDIHYPQKEMDLVAPVCMGNVVKPAEASVQPVVKFESKPEELWTLTLVNPDGHFTEENMEYIHWFVGNIPGDDISKGEIIWDYLPPFPARGIGYQRLIFVLYKQEEKMDYSILKKSIPCLELKDRSFNTLEFYRQRQDALTPAGLSFFQSDWDRTVTKFFHDVLNMEEPVYEYDFLPPDKAKEICFPIRTSFNEYLDTHKDQRDLNHEYLTRILKELNPLEVPKPLFPYPQAVKMNFSNMPTWLARKELNFRQRRGRIRHLLREEYE